MLNFQEQAIKDLENVFFSDISEFVTPTKIGDVAGSPPHMCNVIIDRERYTNQQLKSKSDNVSLNGLLFYIKKSEWLEKFKNMPRIGNSLTFDGDDYTISNVIDDMYNLEISIDANVEMGWH